MGDMEDIFTLLLSTNILSMAVLELHGATQKFGEFDHKKKSFLP
jgi:hypothetical protein